jgi:hypothetical protein
MKLSTLIPLAALCAATLTASAQPRQQPPGMASRWLVEPSITYTLLENDAVSMAGMRVGKQLSDELFIGGSASLLLNTAETFRVNGFDRLNDLLYAGPTIEYSNVFRGRVRYYLGLTLGIGLADYETGLDGAVSDRSGMFAAIAPEAGLQLRIGRRRIWQMRMSLGGVVGTIPGSDVTLYTLPAATFGIRFPL